MSDERRRSELLALADRCEREEPSRELDIAIWSTLNKGIDSTKWITFADFGHSLDAAVTLGPENHEWCVETWEARAMGTVRQRHLGSIIQQWRSVAKSPALALCAAALRARAAIADRGDT